MNHSIDASVQSGEWMGEGVIDDPSPHPTTDDRSTSLSSSASSFIYPSLPQSSPRSPSYELMSAQLNENCASIIKDYAAPSHSPSPSPPPPPPSTSSASSNPSSSSSSSTAPTVEFISFSSLFSVNGPSFPSPYTIFAPLPPPSPSIHSPPTSRPSSIPDGRIDLPWHPRASSDYSEDAKIGEGTYGHVHAARSRQGERVALKKIRKEEKEGFPITAIREIKILKTLNHPNIVRLIDVVSSHAESPAHSEGDVFMVFGLCDHDLQGIIDMKSPLGEDLIKYYMKNILQGLKYLHDNGIMHRDIKGANILVSNDGQVKIADFGLARHITNQKQPGKKSQQFTNKVVTLWYRAPELLLGASDYDYAIDIWSLGCLFAELLSNGKILFGANDDEKDQIRSIFSICGTPDQQSWPELSNYSSWRVLQPAQTQPRCLEDYFRRLNPSVSSEALSLLDGLLTLNPKKRLTATEALSHPYISTQFQVRLPKWGDKNFFEFLTKDQRLSRIKEQEAERKQYLAYQQNPSAPPPSSSAINNNAPHHPYPGNYHHHHNGRGGRGGGYRGRGGFGRGRGGMGGGGEGGNYYHDRPNYSDDGSANKRPRHDDYSQQGGGGGGGGRGGYQQNYQNFRGGRGGGRGDGGGYHNQRYHQSSSYTHTGPNYHHSNDHFHHTSDGNTGGGGGGWGGGGHDNFSVPQHGENVRSHFSSSSNPNYNNNNSYTNNNNNARNTETKSDRSNESK